MNIKERKEFLKKIVVPGTKFRFAQVTQVTPFNCYLDGVRNSWSDIEAAVRRGNLNIDEVVYKNVKIVAVYRYEGATLVLGDYQVYKNGEAGEIRPRTTIEALIEEIDDNNVNA